jgi:3-hydroxyisobutyrate dehydrogenase
MTLQVGCIGLGVFGARIAERLAEEGFPTMIYDAQSDPIRYFIIKSASAADIADAPAMMAELCDVVITVLPTAADVREVALGRAGLVEAASRNCILVDMGTSGAAETKALAEELAPRGIPVLEAPACGTPMDARAGKLIIPVGGEEALIERCMPVFGVLGRKVLRTGPVGSAHAGAALAEYLRASTVLAAGEALLIARKLGMTPQALVDICSAFDVLGPAVAQTLREDVATGRFNSGHTLDMTVRHLDLTLEFGKDLPLRFAALCREMWTAARRERGSEDDYTTIVRWLEKAAAKPGAGAEAGGDTEPMPQPSS